LRSSRGITLGENDSFGEIGSNPSNRFSLYKSDGWGTERRNDEFREREEAEESSCG